LVIKTIKILPEVSVRSKCVVGEVKRVGEVFVVLPNVRQRNVETAGRVPLDGVVLEHPVEKVVGASQISAELSYSSAVVCDQAAVDHEFHLENTIIKI